LIDYKMQANHALQRTRPLPELAATFYGLTEFRTSDPDGNRLWIGQSTPTGA